MHPRQHNDSGKNMFYYLTQQKKYSETENKQPNLIIESTWNQLPHAEVSLFLHFQKIVINHPVKSLLFAYRFFDQLFLWFFLDTHHLFSRAFWWIVIIVIILQYGVSTWSHIYLVWRRTSSWTPATSWSNSCCRPRRYQVEQQFLPENLDNYHDDWGIRSHLISRSVLHNTLHTVFKFDGFHRTQQYQEERGEGS